MYVYVYDIMKGAGPTSLGNTSHHKSLTSHREAEHIVYGPGFPVHQPRLQKRVSKLALPVLVRVLVHQ